MTNKYISDRYTANDIMLMGALADTIYILRKLEDDDEDVAEDEVDDIEDEMMGAENYYDKFIITREPQYKLMARDELKHANFFINEAKKTAKTPIELEKLQRYVDWHNQLSSKLI
ncbi:MAG: hypothetical protein RR806_08350 [Oscillospiraceae bacterium]